MRSNSSTSLAHGRSLGSVRLNSPPLSSGFVHVLGLLDSAVEHLMVRKDFRTALDTCEKGLENLCNLGDNEESSSRHGELKAALCIVGMQALAELNQWRGALSWVLQHYGVPEKIPAKIMQMCILLYTKVGEEATMQEAGSVWLQCPNNVNLAGFGTIAQLYLLHVLVPLGQIAQARELVVSEVGNVAFTEDQRQVALEILESQEGLNQERALALDSKCLSPCPELSPMATTTIPTPRGAMAHRLEALLRLLCRGLSAVRAGVYSLPLCRVLLAAFLVYLLLVRMDPALPSSFPWIFQLLRMFRQTWDAMFGPYYRASAQN